VRLGSSRSLAALLLACACGSPQAPSGVESWTADLAASNRTLSMTFTSLPSFSGSGRMVPLNLPVTFEELTLTGSRLVDSLTITFQRLSGSQFQFAGRYVANGSAISGTLNGDEFVNLGVSFRRR
jgi:hypothetical protein